MISADEFLACPPAAQHRWRVAILDLAGHFAIALPIGDEIVLFNTTGIYKLLILNLFINPLCELFI